MPKKTSGGLTQTQLTTVLNGVTRRLIPALLTSNNGDSLFAGAFERLKTPGKEGTKKDINLECDYPSRSSFNALFFKTLYDYVGPATRAVEIFPSETWKATPAVYESNKKRTTGFEQDWYTLTDDAERNPYKWLYQADRDSLISRYGALLIGLDDSNSGSPELPAAPVVNGVIQPVSEKRNVLYFRSFDESNCQILTFDMNRNSRRYGQPETYQISTQQNGDPGTAAIQSGKTTIHWTRMLHVAWKETSHPSYAYPILQNLVPYIWDLRKVGGGSAEMFWQGAFPGISFETMPEMITEGGNVELDEDSVKEQVDRYMRKMAKYIALTGVHANTLAPNISDPTPHFNVAVQGMCMSLNCPVPVFLGQQVGHLASMANKGMWGEAITGRRNGYATPKLIRGLINRLADLGAVRRPKTVICEWVDANASTDSDKANVALKRAQAFSQFSNSNARFMVSPEDFLIEEMGYTDEKAREVIERAPKKDFVPESVTNPTPKGPAGASGRPAGVISQS